MLTVEATGEALLGPCDCCGASTRRVWGFVHSEPDSTIAAYYVQWVPGAIAEHGAAFDLIVGAWGENTTSTDRTAVSLAIRNTPDGPQFTVVNAEGRFHAQTTIAATAANRETVLNSDLAHEAFRIVDAVWLGEPRIAELLAPAG